MGWHTKWGDKAILAWFWQRLILTFALQPRNWVSAPRRTFHLPNLFGSTQMIKFDGWFRPRTLTCADLIFEVNKYYFRGLKIRKWTDKGVWNYLFSFHFVPIVSLSIYGHQVGLIIAFLLCSVHVQENRTHIEIQIMNEYIGSAREDNSLG